jgi:FKBP-type peptidyl-prolyl cis-trans isomerase (trigger factor)
VVLPVEEGNLFEGNQINIDVGYRLYCDRNIVKLNDRSKHHNKMEEEILEEWKETAEKKAKAHLIIQKISDEEKILPDDEKVRAETEKILMVYKDADPIRARSYVAMILTNEKVFEFLENQK